MKQFILLIHPIQAPIGLAEAEAAVSSSYPGCQIVARIEFTDTRDAWQREPENWETLAKLQAAEFSSKLLPLLLGNPSAVVAYFGLAPIPLILDLATQIGSTRPICVFQKHHTTKDWAWNLPTGRKSKPVTKNLAAVPLSSGGDVVLRVSTSAIVSPQSTRQVLPKPLLEVELAIDAPAVDAFDSQDDVIEFAESVHDALSRITELVPAPSTIHLFGAMQCGVAFAIGTRIEKTRHHPIQSYQFAASSKPQYKQAIRLVPANNGRFRFKVPEIIRNSWTYLVGHPKVALTSLGVAFLVMFSIWAYRDGRLRKINVGAFGLELAPPQTLSDSEKLTQVTAPPVSKSEAPSGVTASGSKSLGSTKLP